MDYSVPEVTSAEREFYGENLILLEGAISEFLSCMDMIRRYEVQLGNRDPVASSQTRFRTAPFCPRSGKSCKGSLFPSRRKAR